MVQDKESEVTWPKHVLYVGLFFVGFVIIVLIVASLLFIVRFVRKKITNLCKASIFVPSYIEKSIKNYDYD